jgi:malonate transporter and related proteins
MVETILSALAPIVFTLLLGFVAAWRHDFGPKEASCCCMPCHSHFS